MLPAALQFSKRRRISLICLCPDAGTDRQLETETRYASPRVLACWKSFLRSSWHSDSLTICAKASALTSGQVLGTIFLVNFFFCFCFFSACVFFYSLVLVSPFWVSFMLPSTSKSP